LPASIDAAPPEGLQGGLNTAQIKALAAAQTTKKEPLPLDRLHKWFDKVPLPADRHHETRIR
jgi:hypothetical protein